MHSEVPNLEAGPSGSEFRYIFADIVGRNARHRLQFKTTVPECSAAWHVTIKSWARSMDNVTYYEYVF